ncbi:MAG: RHS repeat-associated core domain-containing protein [Actinobacteria bacterium]|nr:RHS repeat-associated core domain-containing protein [Actinomycetota bacterium]
MGIRTSKTVTTGTDPATAGHTATYYVVDKNRDYAQVLAEWTASWTGQTAPDPEDDDLAVTYRYGHDLIQQTRDPLGTPTTRYFHYDGQMSTRHLTDASGSPTDSYTYGAYGDLLSQTQPGGGPATLNNYRYTGEQLDPDLGAANTPGTGNAAGLYYLRARYYSPGQGRFTSMDTWQGDPFAPASLHKYSYCQNDPSNRIDPSGHSFTLPSLLSWKGIAITLAAAVIGTYLLAPLFQAIGYVVADAFSSQPSDVSFMNRHDAACSALPWPVLFAGNGFPNTAKGVIEEYKSDIKSVASQTGVPAELLAAVILAEMIHFNYRDTFGDIIPGDHSIGITQIRPIIILEHAKEEPAFCPPSLTASDVRARLWNPPKAIELLAGEIRYHAKKNGVSLDKWGTASEIERRRMVRGFVQSKDNYYDPDGQFGKTCGEPAYQIIKRYALLK